MMYHLCLLRAGRALHLAAVHVLASSPLARVLTSPRPAPRGVTPGPGHWLMPGASPGPRVPRHPLAGGVSVVTVPDNEMSVST